MVLPSPAKNALFDPLFGMGLNSDILTLICCISRINFVRGRAFLIMRPALQSWFRNKEKNSKKKSTFVCMLNNFIMFVVLINPKNINNENNS